MYSVKLSFEAMLLSRYRPERNWAWQHLGHVTRGWLWCQWWLLLVWPRPASCLYLCPFISGHGKYTSYWVSHWSQGGQEGRDPAPWAPREFLHRKLIWRTGFSRSSQRKSVWLDVWIPKSWSKFSWSLCIDICSCLAAGNELQPKLRQSRVSPKEAWCWAVQTSHLSEGCQSFGHAFVALSSPAHRHSPIQSCGLLLTLLCSLVTYSVKRKKKKKKIGELGDLVCIPYASTN